MVMKILLTEDDKDLAKMIALGAQTIWPDCSVALAGDGQTALHTFAAERPDLVLLDVAIPPPDGLEVCQQIRAESHVPILVMTGRDSVAAEVEALHLGADDYVKKPFDILQLLARMQALVRRASGSPIRDAPTSKADFATGDLTIDYTLHCVRVGGEAINLTPTEYVLLEVLARHAGMVVPHQVLLERVWGAGRTEDTHTLKVFISRLRQKFGDDSEHPRYIQTRWGIGYRLVPSA